MRASFKFYPWMDCGSTPLPAFLDGNADLASHCAYAAAQQSFEASKAWWAYAVFSRLPLHKDAGAAAGSQNVAEAAQAEATACVKQLQMVLTGALAAYS